MSRVSLAALARQPANRTLRVRHRMLQTPVVRFEHQGTGRAVTVIAVVHIAQASYYRRLHAILTKLEAAGAVIYYEQIGSAAATEWSAASHAERDARDAAAADRREYPQAVCRYLGWVGQQDALAYAASWRNVDMTDLELVQRSGPQAILDQHTAFADMLGGLTQDQREVLVGAGAAILLRLISLDRRRLLLHLAGRIEAGIRHANRVLVDDRNTRALAALPSDTDSVMVWGSGHLPGLAAGLQQAGYQRQASGWLNAGELPPLQASAKAIWAVLREQRRR
jgi:hypothetical protein